MLNPFRLLFGPRTSAFPDGFGQSAVDDLRFLARLRRCRRVPVTWRRPTLEEARYWDEHPIVGRFGDAFAVAEVDGRRWHVRDRMWHGWPDPPEFAFFSFDPDGSIWAAADFDWWPRAWSRPSAPAAPPA